MQVAVEASFGSAKFFFIRGASIHKWSLFLIVSSLDWETIGGRLSFGRRLLFLFLCFFGRLLISNSSLSGSSGVFGNEFEFRPTNWSYHWNSTIIEDQFLADSSITGRMPIHDFSWLFLNLWRNRGKHAGGTLWFCWRPFPRNNSSGPSADVRLQLYVYSLPGLFSFSSFLS